MIHVNSAPLDLSEYFSRDILNRIISAFLLEYTGILPETVQYELWGSYSSAEMYLDTVQCQLVLYILTDHYTCVCVCVCALVCVCVGVAPHILNFDIRWRWGISFTPQAPNPQGKIPMYPLNRQLHVYMCINNIYCASALLLPLNHWRIPATERIHVTIFWIMTHCSQVDRKQGFRRTYCLCLHRRISVMMMECSIFF